VAETGGITKAAAKLHRVQSNVTTRVKQLEEWLGTQLFLRRSAGSCSRRRARCCSNTQTGCFACPPRRKPLCGAPRRGDPAARLARKHRGDPIAAALSRYHRAYPEVRIELVTGTTGALISNVLSGEIEGAFVAEPFLAGWPRVAAGFSEQLVLITPKNFPKIRTAKNIGHTTILAFPAGCSYRRRLEHGSASRMWFRTA